MHASTFVFFVKTGYYGNLKPSNDFECIIPLLEISRLTNKIPIEEEGRGGRTTTMMGFLTE